MRCLPPNKWLELTPSVRALEGLVTSVGIDRVIGSSRERSSAPSRWAADVRRGSTHALKNRTGEDAGRRDLQLS